MGKPKKANIVQHKNIALDQQITAGKVAKVKHSNKKVHLRSEETSVLDNKTTQKILATAKQQQLELADEDFPTLNVKKGAHVTFGGEQDYESKEDVTENDFQDYMPIDDEDAKAFERFQNPQEGKRTLKLSEIILEKIKEKGTELDTKLSCEGSLKLEEIDKRVKELYEGVRDVMKRYRSGQVPKAFKIIPRLRNWEQILFITEPQNWSAAAMFQATRIFSSGLSQNMAQRFYNLVLLPRVRDDLCEYKKLNMHLYNALKRALFKPAAFMKGIILPLLEAGDCTLREAIIFGSIIARSSIPVLHSSACLLKICEMGYTGACSVFIRFFLDKRYALPYRVVDAAVFHFLRFEHDRRDLPVLWHQSLLTFVQRYKNDISSEQKEALLQLLKHKNNAKITPEIRRELQAASCRDVEMMPCSDNNTMETQQMCTDEEMFD